MEDNKDKEPTIEELQAQLKSLQDSIKEKDSKLTEYQTLIDEDKKKAFEKREAAKEEARKALLEAQKFEDAYKQIQSDYDEYKKSYSTETFSELEKKYNRLHNGIKSKLLDQIPEEDRDVFKSLDIEQLEVVVSKIAKPKLDAVTVDTSTSSAHKVTTTKKWADMSEAERSQLALADPAKMKSLIAEYTKDKK